MSIYYQIKERHQTRCHKSVPVLLKRWGFEIGWTNFKVPNIFADAWTEETLTYDLVVFDPYANALICARYKFDNCLTPNDQLVCDFLVNSRHIEVPWRRQNFYGKQVAFCDLIHWLSC